MRQITFRPDRLRQYIDTLGDTYGVPVYGCSVHIHGEEVFRGGNDLAKGQDFFLFYSTTKPLTGFCAMQLVEQGKLGLFDKVSDYLPAFEHLTVRKGDTIEPLKTPLRIFHLLTMSGGFDYDDEFPEMHALLDGRGPVPCEEAVSLLARRPLHFEPGTHYLYSLGLDILGAVIEKISGMTLDTYMEQNIFRPIGARELTFTPTEEQRARIAPQLYMKQPGPARENHFLHARHFPSGGCGLCGTVDEYMRFLDMLANDGVAPSGRRLLGSEAMNLFRTPMLRQSAQQELLSNRVEPEVQGLGVRVRPCAPLQGMYVGDGAAGAYCLAHKESGVSLFFASNCLGNPDLHPVVHPALFRLTCQALGLTE